MILKCDTTYLIRPGEPGEIRFQLRTQYTFFCKHWSFCIILFMSLFITLFSYDVWPTDKCRFVKKNKTRSHNMLTSFFPKTNRLNTVFVICIWMKNFLLTSKYDLDIKYASSLNQNIPMSRVHWFLTDAQYQIENLQRAKVTTPNDPYNKKAHQYKYLLLRVHTIPSGIFFSQWIHSHVNRANILIFPYLISPVVSQMA